MDYANIIFILLLYHILFNYNNDMSIIKDINELRMPVKAIIISICGFMPFWFVILYYFFPNILSIGWYEKLMFLFVPTIVWYGLGYVSMKQYVSVLERAIKQAPSDTHNDVSFWTVVAIDGLLYLIIITIIAYYFKLTFEVFLWIAFLFRLVTALCMTILNISIR